LYISDLKDVDELLANNLIYFMENNIDEFDFTFSYDRENLDSTVESIELIPNGK
jgi:hypothetical protein